jgi:hypothetical protein
VQSVLSRDALNTVNKVEVFDKGDLETGSRALSGRNGRVGKEKFPDLEDVREKSEKRVDELTRYQRAPYLASTFSLFAVQFLYHRQIVAL